MTHSFWPSQPDDGEQPPPPPEGPLGFGGAPPDLAGDLARLRGEGHPSFRRQAGPGRRVTALVIDIGLAAAIGLALSVALPEGADEGWPGIAAFCALFVLRPVLLATTGATLGQGLTRYRVVGSRGERLTLTRAVWRELSGVITVVEVIHGRRRRRAAYAPFEEAPVGTVRRWPHDYEANTWPVLVDGP